MQEEPIHVQAQMGPSHEDTFSAIVNRLGGITNFYKSMEQRGVSQDEVTNALGSMGIDTKKYGQDEELALMEQLTNKQGIYTPPEQPKEEPKEESLSDYTNLPSKETVEGVGRGAARLPLGAMTLTEQAINSLTDSDSQVISNWIKENEQAIKDKGLDTSALVGEIATNIALGNKAYAAGKITSALGVAGLEGALAYTSATGRGADNHKAISEALLAGTLAGGVTALVNKAFPADQFTKVHSYLKNKLAVSDSEADKMFKDWQKITGEPDTSANRVKALVDGGGVAGAAEKKAALKHDLEAISQVKSNMKERLKEFENATKDKTDIKDLSEALIQGQKNISTQYEIVKNTIADVNAPISLTLPKAFDNATKGVRKQVKELLNEGDTTVGNLLESYKLINDIIRSTKKGTTTERSWVEANKLIDNKIKTVLDIDSYNAWRQVNNDYRKMAQVRDSKVGKALNELINPKKGFKPPVSEVMKVVQNAKVSDDFFEGLEFMVGKQKAAQFENLIIDQALAKNVDELDWGAVEKILSNKEFRTPAGKKIQELIGDMNRAFNVDKELSNIRASNPQLSGSGLSSELAGRFKVLLTSRAVRYTLKKLSKNYRMEEDLVTILKSPTKLDGIKKQLDSLTTQENSQILMDTRREFNDLVKLPSWTNKGEMVPPTE